MTLHDVSIYGEKGYHHLQLDQGIITSISRVRPPGDDLVLDLQGGICLPGFINSHDHLDFNLYPSLGNRTYQNYTEWGPYIHEQYQDIISEIQAVPLATRIAWGIYKNLMNGFTSVVNHGVRLPTGDAPVSVFQDNQSLHSPAFEKEWKWKINNPFRIRQPVVMHVGEGTDEVATKEISEVTRGNRLGRQLVGVHGVAMDAEQADHFHGLVWCPASNYFLLGRTADMPSLKNHTRVVFGTDSTLTAPWNCWEHFRQAMAPGAVTEGELLEMLTSSPAALWGMGDRGSVQEGKTADLLVIKNTASLFDANPEDILLVVHQGKIRLADDQLALPAGISSPAFSKVSIRGSHKWVYGDIQKLTAEIKSYYPSFQPPFSDAG